jgi:O-acetyl-ADP-ribose deacetylase (regulator of RNase III)
LICVRAEPAAVVEVIQGDITRLDVDCIVNAANERLAGGGGVDGAIHRAAGPELDRACHAIGRCPTGEVRLTPGFGLPARCIIHAVGPVFRDGRHGEPEALAACYRNALELASAEGMKSIAFPAISCGIYGYPVAAAARIALREIGAYLQRDRKLERIVLCCFDTHIHRQYQEAKREILDQ